MVETNYILQNEELRERYHTKSIFPAFKAEIEGNRPLKPTRALTTISHSTWLTKSSKPVDTNLTFGYLEEYRLILLLSNR